MYCFPLWDEIQMWSSFQKMKCMCYQLSECVHRDERQKQACWAQARGISCRPPETVSGAKVVWHQRQQHDMKQGWKWQAILWRGLNTIGESSMDGPCVWSSLICSSNPVGINHLRNTESVFILLIQHGALWIFILNSIFNSIPKNSIF